MFWMYIQTREIITVWSSTAPHLTSFILNKYLNFQIIYNFTKNWNIMSFVIHIYYGMAVVLIAFICTGVANKTLSKNIFHDGLYTPLSKYWWGLVVYF